MAMEMDQSTPDFQDALTTRDRSECMEMRFVLEAAGIPAQADHHDGWWQLIVDDRDRGRAIAELEAYRHENRASSLSHEQPFPKHGGAGVAVAAFAMSVIAVDVLDARWALGTDWKSAGAMQAGKVMEGQWWRCLTALTLHVDAGHLISNLVFGTVFGLIAGRILGGGVAWLSLVIAGALGNFVNALLRSPDHSSIGASTAVFAALGMIVLNALRGGRADRQTMMRRWSPLIGGLVLFSFTGMGSERTDVVAHSTGFLAGMLMGWIGTEFPATWLANKKVQVLAGLTAIALITAAWFIALNTAVPVLPAG